MAHRTIGLSLVAFFSCLFALMALASYRWQSSTKEIHRRIKQTIIEPPRAFLDPSEIDQLPEPVKNHLKTVLGDRASLISSVTIEQTGIFNMGEGKQNWKRFKASQYVITHPPNFVWDARIRIAPFASVFVHDAYVAGEGIVDARLFGLVRLVQAKQGPELNQGELMRYLAEAVWFPTALLPSQGVKWQAIDDKHARATLSDRETTVTLVFEFDDRNLISSVYTEARARIVDKEVVLTPWQGRFWNYQRCDGVLVPLEGEVAWIIDGKRLPYWRGKIEKIEFRYFEP